MQTNLPNFLVVGSTKAGTTSLYNYLQTHQQVYLNKDVKESNFFVEPKDVLGCGPRHCGKNSYGKSLDDYKRLFLNSNDAEHSVIGEICTTYLHFSKNTIPNIKKHLDDPKILIILRNPIDRAYSFYMHNVRDGDENLSFEQALISEERRKEQKLWLSFYYKELGNYYQDVKNYKENFKDVKVLIYEDMKNDINKFMGDIYSFIQVDYLEIDATQKFNISGLPKNQYYHNFVHGNNFMGKVFLRLISFFSNRKFVNKIQNMVDHKNLIKTKINKETKLELEQYYFNDVKNLSQLLGIDLNNKWNIRSL